MIFRFWSVILFFFAITEGAHGQLVQFGFFRQATVPAASTCPINYIEVPSLSGYTTSNFCVMKYEAKKSGAIAASRPDSLPWGNQTRDQAITDCTNNGAKYALITNAQWQTIARNIELQSLNWSTGVIGFDLINFGNSKTSPAMLEASANDDDACFGTGHSCDRTPGSWNEYRRVHKLSNGNWIWDFAGNAEEWVSDTFAGNIGTTWLATTTDPTIKSLVGPATDFTLAGGAKNAPAYGHVGALIGSAGSAAARGAHSTTTNDLNGGVFTFIQVSPAATHAYRGFRCVYNP